MAADHLADGLGRGRRSRRRHPRVWESGPCAASGIVPAAQAAVTLAPRGPQSHSLMPLITDVRRLRRAARACMRRCSAPGVDRVSWADFRRGLTDNLNLLAEELRDGRWQPGPLREVELSAYTGKRFTVVVPTVRDRVVQRVLRDAVTPILEATVFEPFVSGWARPGRNRLTAVRQAASHLTAGRVWAADIDVERVSAGATMEQVMDLLARWVHDGTFLLRMRTALRALPDPLVAGTVLAPTLLNLRLAPVDRALVELPVVRFADNYVVFADDSDAAQRAYDRVADALAAVGMRASPTKSRVHRPNPEDLFLIAG